MKWCRNATFLHTTKTGLSQGAAQWVALNLTVSCSTLTSRGMTSSYASAYRLPFIGLSIRPVDYAHMLFILFYYLLEVVSLVVVVQATQNKCLCMQKAGVGSDCVAAKPVLSCLIGTPCKVFWEIWHSENACRPHAEAAPNFSFTTYIYHS